MNHHSFRLFLKRRLAPEEYLGLHLTVGLFLCLLLVGLFGIIAHYVVGPHRLTVFDTQLGLLLQQHRHDHPGVRHFFLVVTQFASVWLMVSLTLLMALVLLIRQRRMLALVWVLALVACGLLNLALKEVFSRDRPPFHDVAIHETTESFPSGHSMGAITAYGLLAFMAVQSRLRRRIRTGIVLTLALLILAIGFSRIYLGAHYFSDVIGGLTVGGAWLIACLSGLEVARRRMTNKEEEVKDEG